jgi:hypothetical protein
MNWSVLKLQFLRVTSPLMQNVVDKIRWISLNLPRSNSIPLYSHYIITLHFISKPWWVLCNRNQSIHRFLMVRLNDTLNLIETTALHSYELSTKMLTIHKNPLYPFVRWLNPNVCCLNTEPIMSYHFICWLNTHIYPYVLSCHHTYPHQIPIITSILVGEPHSITMYPKFNGLNSHAIIIISWVLYHLLTISLVISCCWQFLGTQLGFA